MKIDPFPLPVGSVPAKVQIKHNQRRYNQDYEDHDEEPHLVNIPHNSYLHFNYANSQD